MTRWNEHGAAIEESEETRSESEGQKLLQHPPPKAALSPQLFSRLCWRILPILWGGYVLNIVDRTNLGYAQLQMADDLHLTPRAFGLASGMFFFSYALVQVPANELMVYIGARRILCTSMALWGLLSASTSLVQSEVGLYVLRFGLGLAESAYFPGVLLYLTRWFPDAVAGQVLAYYSTAASVGSLVSSAGSGLLMSGMDGVCGVRGWRWLLLLQGLPTLLLGSIAPFILAEHPSQASWLSASEKAELLHALESDARHGPRDMWDGRSFMHVIVRTIARPATGLLALQYVGVSATTNIARFFLPMQLKEVFPHLPPSRIGLFFAVPAGVKVVLAPAIALWADTAPERRFWTAWGMFALASALLLSSAVTMLASMQQDVWRAAATVALLSCAEVLTNCGIPVFWSLHHAVQPTFLNGCSIALVNSIGNLGGFVGPFVLGAVHDYVGNVCGPNTTQCTAQWGPGTALVGAAFAAVTIATGAAWRNWVSLSSRIVHVSDRGSTDDEPDGLPTHHLNGKCRLYCASAGPVQGRAPFAHR